MIVAPIELPNLFLGWHRPAKMLHAFGTLAQVEPVPILFYGPDPLSLVTATARASRFQAIQSTASGPSGMLRLIRLWPAGAADGASRKLIHEAAAQVQQRPGKAGREQQAKLWRGNPGLE